jgi:tetratricopeptide (TPR) repeat protein
MKPAANDRSAKAPHGFGAWRRFGAAACLLLVAFVVVYVFWIKRDTTQPPQVDLSQADPEVARVLEAAREQVLQQPSSGANWGELAQIFHVHGFVPEAIVCYTEAERRDPANPRWPYLQSLLQAERDTEKWLACLKRAAAAGDKEPALKSSLTQALIELERYDEAMPLLQEMTSRDRSNAFALYGLGRVAFARGDFPASKQYLEQSLALQPQIRGPHLLLAQVSQRLGEEKRAEYEWQLASRITVERYWTEPYLEKLYQHEVGRNAFLRRAQLLGAAGHPDRAELVLIDAVRAYPGSAQAHLELGKVQLFLRRFPRAETELREALRLDPSLMTANFFLGMCLREQKRYADAISYLRKTIEIQPQFAGAHYELGLCLEAQGDSAGAIDAYRDAVRYMPSLASAHKQLGFLLVKAKRPDDARPHLEQAATLLPDDEEVKNLLAEVKPPEKKPATAPK